MSLDVQQNTMDHNNNIHDKILRTTFTTTTCYSNTYQRRRLRRYKSLRDHAKESNVKLVELTSFMLYLLHSRYIVSKNWHSHVGLFISYG